MRPITDYEYKLFPVGDIKPCTDFDINVFGATLPKGTLGVRVKSIGGNPPSEWMFNEQPFYINQGIARVDLTFVVEDLDPNKIVKTPGLIEVTNANGSTYPAEYLCDCRMTIKLRGNLTLLLPKKSFAIDLLKEDFSNNKIELLRFEKSQNFSLLAEKLDMSLQRNTMVFRVAKALGYYWNPTGRAVEVYINGEYNGVYTLIEKVERDTKRINIASTTVANTTFADITFHNEQVNNAQETIADLAFSFTTPLTNNYGSKTMSQMVKYPKDVSPTQLAIIRDGVRAMETALFTLPFEDTINGYRKYLDVDSFAQFYVFNEIMKNADGTTQSLFYTKDRNGLIKAGPLWDFDIAAGNYDGFPELNSPIGIVFDNHPWFAQLLTDPFFLKVVKFKYYEISRAFLADLDNLDKFRDMLNDIEATDRNFTKWPISPKTFDEEIEFLKDWIEKRIKFLDPIYLPA